MLDARRRRRQRVRNRAQALLLLGGMVAVAALLASLIFGAQGVLWVLAMGLVLLAWQPKVPASWVLASYGARPLPVHAAPVLHRYVAVLSDRAGLRAPPVLYYVPSPILNAFAVGRRDDAALAVTDGLLRGLTSRELVGVLAHEVSHVRADDLRIMSLSDTVARLTQALSYTGLLLAAMAVPFASGAGWVVWLVVLALVSVPTVVTLLQLALSRSREYDADLEAAVLTGDPEGLASALVRLERSGGRTWERVMVPRGRTTDVLLLRTHPPTEERVRRLLELRRVPDRAVLGDGGRLVPQGYREVTTAPRLRFPGVRW